MGWQESQVLASHREDQDQDPSSPVDQDQTLWDSLALKGPVDLSPTSDQIWEWVVCTMDRDHRSWDQCLAWTSQSGL